MEHDGKHQKLNQEARKCHLLRSMKFSINESHNPFRTPNLEKEKDGEKKEMEKRILAPFSLSVKLLSAKRHLMDNELVHNLLRFVIRGFYGKYYVLILDALLIHSVLSEDDLGVLINIPRKNLRASCNKLVDDRLMIRHQQKEDFGPQQRQTAVTYYYIHFVEAIDSIKWKMHSIVKQLKDEMARDGDPQGYMCSRCRSKFSQLEALPLLSEDKTSFICSVCDGELIEDDSGVQAKARQEKLSRLMSQLDPIIYFLKKVDDTFIADNTFETALTRAVPAQSTQMAAYSIPGKRKAVSEASQSNQSQATLHVRITANDENVAKEKEDLAKKHEALKQNALPSWHAQSTVGQDAEGGVNETTDAVEPETPIQAPSEGTKALEDKEAEEALASYYAQIAAKREDEAEEELDEDDEFEDVDDEFDFENV